MTEGFWEAWDLWPAAEETRPVPALPSAPAAEDYCWIHRVLDFPRSVLPSYCSASLTGQVRAQNLPDSLAEETWSRGRAKAAEGRCEKVASALAQDEGKEVGTSDPVELPAVELEEAAGVAGESGFREDPVRHLAAPARLLALLPPARTSCWRSAGRLLAEMRAVLAAAAEEEAWVGEESGTNWMDTAAVAAAAAAAAAAGWWEGLVVDPVAGNLTCYTDSRSWQRFGKLKRSAPPERTSGHCQHHRRRRHLRHLHRRAAAASHPAGNPGSFVAETNSGTAEARLRSPGKKASEKGSCEEECSESVPSLGRRRLRLGSQVWDRCSGNLGA